MALTSSGGYTQTMGIDFSDPKSKRNAFALVIVAALSLGAVVEMEFYGNSADQGAGYASKEKPPWLRNLLSRPEGEAIPEAMRIASTSMDKALPYANFLNLMKGLKKNPATMGFADAFISDSFLSSALKRYEMNDDFPRFLSEVRRSEEFKSMLKEYAARPGFRETVHAFAGNPAVRDLLVAGEVTDEAPEVIIVKRASPTPYSLDLIEGKPGDRPAGHFNYSSGRTSSNSQERQKRSNTKSHIGKNSGQAASKQARKTGQASQAGISPGGNSNTGATPGLVDIAEIPTIDNGVAVATPESNQRKSSKRRPSGKSSARPSGQPSGISSGNSFGGIDQSSGFNSPNSGDDAGDGGGTGAGDM